MFQRSARLQYLLLALVAVLSLTHFFLGAKQNFITRINGEHIARRPFFGGYTNATISTLLPEARDAGLSVGDTVLTLNGYYFTGNIYFQRELEQSHPGQPLTVTYHRPGDPSPRTATITLRPVQTTATPLWAWIVLTVITTVSFFCLLTGLYVVFARPRNPHAWLILGILAYFNSLFASIPLLTGPFTSIALFWSVIAQTAMPLCLMAFGIYFPERSAIDIRFPWIKWLFITPILLFLPIDLLVEFSRPYNFSISQWVVPYSLVIN